MHCKIMVSQISYSDNLLGTIAQEIKKNIFTSGKIYGDDSSITTLMTGLSKITIGKI